MSLRKVIRIKPRKNIFEPLGVKNIDITEIAVHEREKRIELTCVIASPGNLHELDKIEEALHKKFGGDSYFDFGVEFLKTEINKDELKEIIERIIREIKKTNAISRSFLYLYRINIQPGFINIELKNQVAVDTLLGSNIDYKLNTALQKYGVDNFQVKLVTGDFSKELEEIDAGLIKITKELEKKVEDLKVLVASKEQEALNWKSKADVLDAQLDTLPETLEENDEDDMEEELEDEYEFDYEEEYHDLLDEVNKSANSDFENLREAVYFLLEG